ncbi:TIR domain-containing protein [Amycolatopsis rifamycinica]|uniref:TIR domain-containing protein n=1 Tax=Amycolatopsis rifamycinica TaxID=287986 RepID=A0A066U8P6_9PSEU|nr:TIR domain-containing protein [Amycolatopsis rifamycinica]KDN22192.1 hypothetical protein DV20_09755 [Amycolatopsis rifamycinica]
MDRENSTEFREVAVVSCDILGHSSASELKQVRRVAAINRIVGDAIHRREPGKVVWSSGGDGGHVVFLGDDWQADAVRLIDELTAWAREEQVILRVTGHLGSVATLFGADMRTQVVGAGINFAGWLIRQATGDGVVVSDTFRRGIASSALAADVEFHDERLRVDRASIRQLLWLMSSGTARSRWAKAETDDLTSLKNCLKKQDGWGALYYAKRISQINAKDEAVTSHLEDASRILKADTLENRSFLESLRAEELTEMLKLGHLVERTPGEVICRVGEPGESMFVILRGEVGVYNLEGSGFGGTAEPKHTHRAGEVVGELAAALKRTRTADLVAMTDVALLSFISEEVNEKLANTGTEAGKDAKRQYDRFILDRVVQHTAQVAPYLLGANRRGPLSLVDARSSARLSEREAWQATLRQLLNYTELVTVDTGLHLTVDQVTGKIGRPSAERGLFVLVSGSVETRDPVPVTLSGAQCPLLWVNLPDFFTRAATSYRRVAEPIMVLWLAAHGVDQLSLDQRNELLRALKGVVGAKPPDFEYDVYLCHASPDKPVIREIKDRLWRDYGIRSWYDDVELLPGDTTRRTIEKGLMTCRFLLLCASSNLKKSEWANREIDSVLHLDVKRQGEPKILVLKLYEQESNDEAVPLIVRGTKRHHFGRRGDFERLAEYIVDAREAGGRPQT